MNAMQDVWGHFIHCEWRKKNDSNNKRKARTKTTMKNQVKWQSNDNVTIRLSAHTGSAGIHKHTHTKKRKWREKKPKNRIAWCKFVSFTRQLFHCVYACVFISNVVQRVYSLLIAIILLLISFYIFPNVFFSLFVSSAQLPSLLLPRIPHTNAYIACILYSIHFCLWFLF